MHRLSLALVVALICAFSATAAPSRQKQPTKPAVTPSVDNSQAANPTDNDQYVMTRNTQVLLDDEPSTFEAVPDSAVITSMEVGPDRRTIMRVFFRTKAK